MVSMFFSSSNFFFENVIDADADAYVDNFVDSDGDCDLTSFNTAFIRWLLDSNSSIVFSIVAMKDFFRSRVIFAWIRFRSRLYVHIIIYIIKYVW